ncbi:MAG: AAA family ATPase, partial [Deltaproteobacteria bacterium]|nr:AAA family ATPase [Deltaproteobacteria bacterium]
MPQSGNLKKRRATGIGLTGLSVRGFKSLLNETHIEISPLTILAGANSSGKSSIMQSLLLLKQTLEAPFDPGSLQLSGPNLRVASIEQLLSRKGGTLQEKEIYVKVESAGRWVALS